MVNRTIHKIKPKFWKFWKEPEVIVLTDCSHNWKEIGAGQIKLKEYDCSILECGGDTKLFVCKKCGLFKRVLLDKIIETCRYY